MRALRWLAALRRSLRRRSAAERELADELASVLELLEDEKRAAGASPEEARRAARLELGGADQVAEAVRDVRPGRFLEQAWQDARYAVRTLAKSPAFAAVAIATLALGIGATTAIYSVVHAALIEPLPYRDPGTLAVLWSEFRAAGQPRVPASGPELSELSRRSRLLESVGGIWVGSGSLTGRGEPEQVRAAFVTANFLSVLGVRPQLGRLFAPGEEGPSAAPLLVVSDGLWRRKFGADPAAVGRTVRIDGEAHTVVGVLPPGFELVFPSDASVPADIAVWTPFRDDLAQQPRDLNYVRMIARLRRGVSISEAQSELDAITRALRSEFREYREQGLHVSAQTLHRDASREVRPILLALSAGVVLVALIACANVANLLLARATRRGREMALRAALGAGRARIVRQLVTESLILALLGGGLGVGVAAVGLRLLLALRPEALARLAPPGLSVPVLLATLLASLATGLLCGLAPVFSLSRANPAEALNERVRAGGDGRPQRLLVLAEVALGFVLLAGSGLALRTFLRLVEADPGFRPAGVLTFQITLPRSRYPDDAARRRVFRALLERLEAIPGVAAAGAVSHIPFDDYPNWYENYWRDGASAAEQKTRFADHRAVLPGYFRAIGAPPVEGRDFTLADDALHPSVVVVDESLARTTWPGERAVGKRVHVTFLREGSFQPVEAEVVGVVRHLRSHALGRDGRAQVYVPYLQSPRWQLGFVVHAPGDLRTLAPAIRRAVSGLDPDLAISRTRPLADYVAAARGSVRFTAAIAAALAMLALALACVGIYGLVAYSVAARRAEIGVRMALGCAPGAILGMVLGGVLRLTAAGLGAGVAVSFGVSGILRKLLEGAPPHDAVALAAAAATLVAAAVVAALLPARRAMRIDPAVALRAD